MNYKLLTKKEVSEQLKVSIGTVDNYRKAGKLIACRIGRKVYFKEKSLLDALKDENTLTTKIPAL